MREEVHAILDAHPDDTGYTAEELALLAQYEGGGGLGEAGAAAEATLSEFYTPQPVIDKTWELLDAYAPGAKKVLEPAGGTGRFAAGRTGNVFTIQEINPVAARIAKILHPNATVRVGAYQSIFFDPTGRARTGQNPDRGLYELVAGNFPYGVNDSEWRGRGEGGEFDRVEEYFASRGLDALEMGGLMACVMPSGFLRTLPDRAKEIIAQKGELIDAWRLPNGAFPTTDIGTDIVVFRRSDAANAEEAARRAALLANDSWFQRHPDHIIGVQGTRRGRYGREEAEVRLRPGETLETALARVAPNPELAREGEKRRAEAAKPKIEAQPAQGGADAPVPFVKASVTKKNRAKAEPAPAAEQPVLDGGTMSAAEFAAKYGKEYSEELMQIWRNSDHEGVVEYDSLPDSAQKYVSDHPDDYLMVAPERYQHRELYASGNIYAKLDALEADQADPHTALPAEVAERNRRLLTEARPEVRPMEKIAFQADTDLAATFTVEVQDRRELDENGNPEVREVSLAEGFVAWATGYLDPESGNQRSLIRSYATTPIAAEDIPEGCSWADIVGYIDGDRPQTNSRRGSGRKSKEEEEADAVAAARKRELRRETANKLFNRYLQTGLTPGQKTALCAEWNRRFNAVKQADYSKLPFFVDGMAKVYKNSEFTLNDSQLRGVPFLCQAGNGLLAYDVGVGKTAAGVVATVHQIQSGRAKRPLVIVPKSVYSKWLSDFNAFFPGVKVNDLGNFSNEKLVPFRDPKNPHALQIEEGSVSVCTIEALQNISVTDRSILGPLYADFADILGSAATTKDMEEWDHKTDKDRAKERQTIADAIGVGSAAKDANFVFWEECGFDGITVDEAHRFKNLFKQPRARAGATSNEYGALGTGSPSKRALKLFALTSLVQRENNGRNVFLLTATPFTNSPLEIYSMLSYIAREQLHAMHLNNLRDFIAEYAELKNEWSVQPDGSIKAKQVMKSFQQLGSLQNLITQFIDKVDGEQAGVVRPQKRTHVIKLQMTDVQQRIMDREIDRMLDKDEAENGGVLKAMNNMRMAMLSPALVNPTEYPDTPIPGPEQIVESSPKLKLICDTVADGWKHDHAAGQVVYMPRGVEQYKWVKNYLVSKGVPPEAIEFIHGQTPASTKDKIVDRFNDGEHPLKIIIGSEAIAEGVDLNHNSTTIYNAMLGWNPTESLQVEGRIWRQGNEQGIVHSVYPLIENSIDALLMQKHDEKSARLKKLWSYNSGDRLNVADIDPEELKFDLIRDPVKRADFLISQRLADIDGEVIMLHKQKETLQDFKDSFFAINDQMEGSREALSNFSERLAEEIKSQKEFKTLPVPSDPYKAKLHQSQLNAMERDIKWYKSHIDTATQSIAGFERRITTLVGRLVKMGIPVSEHPDADSINAAIDKKISSIDRKIKGVEGKRETIVAERFAVIAEETKKEAARQVKLKPADVLQAELSESILTDLRPMEEILREQKEQDRFHKEAEAARAAAQAAQGQQGPAPEPERPAAPAQPAQPAPPTAGETTGQAPDPLAEKVAATLKAIAANAPTAFVNNSKKNVQELRNRWAAAPFWGMKFDSFLDPRAASKLAEDKRATEMSAVAETVKNPDLIYDREVLEGLFPETKHTRVKTFKADGLPGATAPLMTVQIDAPEEIHSTVKAKDIKISYNLSETALKEHLAAAFAAPDKIIYLADVRAAAMELPQAPAQGAGLADEAMADLDDEILDEQIGAAEVRPQGKETEREEAVAQGQGWSR